jgi:hypothetical protein
MIRRATGRLEVRSRPAAAALFVLLVPAASLAAGGAAAQAAAGGAAPQAAAAAAAAVLRVDGRNPACSDRSGSPFCTLQAAIRLANSQPRAATIELAANGTYTLSEASEVNLTEGGSGLPGVTGTLTILGHGSIVERRDAPATPPFRILWVTASGDLHLADLTIRFGLTENDYDGAGIWNLGKLDLERVTLTRNVADDDGGGIRNDGTLTVRGCTFSDNVARGRGGTGGGLYNLPVGGAGVAVVTGSTFSGNHAGDNGGAIWNSGTLTVRNSTLSANSAATTGGGFRNIGTIVLNNVTIMGNRAGEAGGSFSNLGEATLSNTAAAGGEAPESPDCEGTLSSAGHNLIEKPAGCSIEGDPTGNVLGRPPLLGPLADHGGLARTHRPLPASPLIGAGSTVAPGGAGACEVTDQRGAARRKAGEGGKGGCDIGACEAAGILPASR